MFKPKKPASTLTGARAFVYKTVDPASSIACLGCGAEDHGKLYRVPAPIKFDKLAHADECPYKGWLHGFPGRP